MRWALPVLALVVLVAAAPPAAAGVLAPAAASGESAVWLAAASAPPSGAMDGDSAALLLTIIMVGAAIAALAAMKRRGVFGKKAFSPAQRDPHGLPAMFWALAGVGMFFAAPLGVILATSLAGGSSGGGGSTREIAISTIGAVAPGIALGALILLMRPAETKKAGLRLRPADAPLGAAALLLVFPIIWVVNFVGRAVATGVAQLTGGEAPQVLAHSTLRTLAEAERDVWWWGVVAGVTIGAPLFEELMYRGFLQSAFAAAFGSRWTAILLSGALFTGAHIGTVSWHVLPGLFALSVALGALFERTGRLGVAIAAHAAFNALNLLLALAM